MILYNNIIFVLFRIIIIYNCLYIWKKYLKYTIQQAKCSYPLLTGQFFVFFLTMGMDKLLHNDGWSIITNKVCNTFSILNNMSEKVFVFGRKVKNKTELFQCYFSEQANFCYLMLSKGRNLTHRFKNFDFITFSFEPLY